MRRKRRGEGGGGSEAEGGVEVRRKRAELRRKREELRRKRGGSKGWKWGRIEVEVGVEARRK